MTKSEYAIMQIEQMARNITVYASYYDRGEDVYGEVDNAVDFVERALLNLCEVMQLNKVEEDV